MMLSLTELCRECKNWFEQSRYRGTFTISGGVINLSDMVADGSLQNGQYFRIMGSVFNDGVHQYPSSDLDDEVFKGTVIGMAVPKDFIALLGDINQWIETYGADAQKPYASESFDGYSYTIKGSLSGGYSGSDNTEPWVATFSSRLAKWRKL